MFRNPLAALATGKVLHRVTDTGDLLVTQIVNERRTSCNQNAQAKSWTVVFFQFPCTVMIIYAVFASTCWSCADDDRIVFVWTRVAKTKPNKSVTVLVGYFLFLS